MDSTKDWEHKERTPDSISGERRCNQRYDLQLDLKWKLIRRRRVLDTGMGRTADLSSRGILFDARREISVGLNLELSITWPVLLHNVAPLQLIVSGRVVRSDGGRVAVEIQQHEFRTVGVPASHRATLAATSRKPSATLTGGKTWSSFGKIQ